MEPSAILYNCTGSGKSNMAAPKTEKRKYLRFGSHHVGFPTPDLIVEHAFGSIELGGTENIFSAETAFLTDL